MKNIVLALILMFGAGTIHAIEIYDIPLQIIFVDNVMEIPRQQLKNGSPIYAGTYEQTWTKCKVYVLRPGTWDDDPRLYTLGHEVYHCVKGPHTQEYIDKHYAKN